MTTFCSLKTIVMCLLSSSITPFWHIVLRRNSIPTIFCLLVPNKANSLLFYSLFQCALPLRVHPLYRVDVCTNREIMTQLILKDIFGCFHTPLSYLLSIFPQSSAKLLLIIYRNFMFIPFNRCCDESQLLELGIP